MQRRLAISVLCVAIAAAVDIDLHAQNVIAQARSAPSRAEGLALLEAHLVSSPADVDARLVYGLMLSWEGRYDDARRELQRVLTDAPLYTDARAGLMNVEWWSGNAAAARELSDAILLRDPGHAQARLVRQRLDASDRPWTIAATATVDSFNDDRDAWHEEALTASRQTQAGPVIARMTRAGRFGLTDEQIEVEFYPTFRPGTYAFVGVGGSTGDELFPRSRLAFDLFQALGRGFEASAGYRRLGFDDTVHMYVGSLAKYAGAWLVTARVNLVDASGSGGETSGQVSARRYFGADGTSYAGAAYIRGLNRDEIRGAGDLGGGDRDTLRAELSALLTRRLRLLLDARTTRESRQAGAALRQHTLSAGAAVRF